MVGPGVKADSMTMLSRRRAAAGRVLAGWALLLALDGCKGGEADDATEGTADGATVGTTDSDGPPGPTSASPSTDGPDTGGCLPGERGCPCILGGVCDDGLVCEAGTCESFDPVCGDGRVEGDEQCDLGEALDDEGECKTDCTLASCGDGLLGPGEQCDDGNLIAQDQCTNACRLPACGDGVLHDGEQCDDDNLDDGDACTNACTEATCGDGSVWRGQEPCDDGNAVSTDACINCVAATCGDGFVWRGQEPCDDANAVSTDACIDCVAATCGDGHRWAGVEACDGTSLGGQSCQSQGFAGGTLTCTASCTYNTSACTPA